VPLCADELTALQKQPKAAQPQHLRMRFS
jgi:hypothetical protein